MAFSWLGSFFEKWLSIPGLVPSLMILLYSLFARQAWKSLPVKTDEKRFDVRAVTLLFACFGLGDWLLIALLPRLQISFGFLPVPLFLVLLARLVILTLIGMIWEIGRRFRPQFFSAQGLRRAFILLCLFNLAILAGEIDALVIEPLSLQTTQLTLTGLPNPMNPPLRILHISDLHVERTSRRELAMLKQAKALQPDLIFLTGDYVNLDYRGDPQTWQDARSLLEQLDAPYGVYAVPGTAGVDIPASLDYIFTGLNIRLLRDEVQKIEVKNQVIYVLGIDASNQARDARVLNTLVRQIPADAYRILLYHTPDLIEFAAQEAIDLYLAGHTHGGQVRLPFYGALITFSIYGKQFEAGLYHRGPTTLYVSRGIGMEGMGFPRARFLCPPEITLIELSDER